jgi:hypothetical protein
MSKSASLFNDIMRDFARSQARFAKRQQRDQVALLDVLVSDDDFSEALDLRDAIARENETHARH